MVQTIVVNKKNRLLKKWFHRKTRQFKTLRNNKKQDIYDYKPRLLTKWYTILKTFPAILTSSALDNYVNDAYRYKQSF